MNATKGSRKNATSVATEVRDLLVDLRHDLVKYLRLPLTMLPVDASQAEIATALETALLRTRRAAGQTRSAEDIWQQFLTDLGDHADTLEGFDALAAAVASALRWRSPQARTQPIDRRAVLADFDAIASAIDGLLES